jgi:hypothetical protein
MVASPEPDARSGRVGWKATDKTASVCPCIVAIRVGFCGIEQSHNSTLESKKPDARSGKCWVECD